MADAFAVLAADVTRRERMQQALDLGHGELVGALLVVAAGRPHAFVEVVERCRLVEVTDADPLPDDPAIDAHLAEFREWVAELQGGSGGRRLVSPAAQAARANQNRAASDRVLAAYDSPEGLAELEARLAGVGGDRATLARSIGDITPQGVTKVFRILRERYGPPPAPEPAAPAEPSPAPVPAPAAAPPAAIPWSAYLQALELFPTVADLDEAAAMGTEPLAEFLELEPADLPRLREILAARSPGN